MHPTIYYYRRTGNRGQTCLPVGLYVIGRVRDNSPLPARHQNKYGSQKPRPRSALRLRRRLSALAGLVQASISSLHHLNDCPESLPLSTSSNVTGSYPHKH